MIEIGKYILPSYFLNYFLERRVFIMDLLYNKTNYKAPVNHVINEYIREYDISKANISILRDRNILSENDYQYFLRCGRAERQIKIGMMIKNDPTIYDVIKSGIIEAKRKLFTENNILDSEVLQIRNDAVFLLNREPTRIDFGLVKFSLRNVYTSFYKITNLEFFYFLDQVSGIENLSVTGINNDQYINSVYPQHKDYFIDFLLTIFETAQNSGISDVIDILTAFYDSYINRDLDIGFYREFNSRSYFKIANFNTALNDSYLVPNLSQDQLKYVDIETNRKILQDLFMIFTNIKMKG